MKSIAKRVVLDNRAYTVTRWESGHVAITGTREVRCGKWKDRFAEYTVSIRADGQVGRKILRALDAA